VNELPHKISGSWFISIHITQHVECCQGSNHLYSTTIISVIVLYLYNTTMGNQQSLLDRIGAAKLEKQAALMRGTSGAPRTISDCFKEDGTLDEALLFKFNQEKARQQTVEATANQKINAAIMEAFLFEEEEGDSVTASQPPKRRRKEKGLVFYTTVSGERKVMPPTMSFWYNFYCSPEVRAKTDHEPKFLKKFRRRFRLPYPSYLDLCEMIIADPIYFQCWKPGTKDAMGKPCAPIHLLILTSLRYLGRGWTFDDCEEATAISEDVCHVFFHEFVLYGQKVLFPKYVVAPRTQAEAESCMAEFALAGFPGCIGSMDASHVCLERVEFRLRQPHLANKLHTTARSYNIVTNHRRRILSTTEGHPATWNDKTLVRFDRFVMGLKKGKYHSNLRFKLYAYDGNGNVIERTYCGAWLLVDNGYHNWGITIPPFKRSMDRAEIRFSQWLESMRKDVECTFGILKGRWRILKAGIRVHGIDIADKIWLTCCALHNLLLDVDGLDERWSAGIPSDWAGELGRFDGDDTYLATNLIPMAIQRLNDPDAIRNYDTSSAGIGEDFVAQRAVQDAAVNLDTVDDSSNSTILEQIVVNDEAVVVRNLSMKQFRQRLVTHFDIAFQRREIRWPSRMAVAAPNIA
jgi:hypothetical protein